MEQILSRDNLNAAYLQVVRNKGAAGVDGMAVEELGDYLSENGENIREQLRTRCLNEKVTSTFKRKTTGRGWFHKIRYRNQA
ncbi:hypothetical protein [Hornefia butyriciproducens]|uniref:hypothetical protein n=1 Tax=Hornefia butyriciproducens TaxID=2652293 RepID=UPI0038B3C5B6